MAQKKSHPKSRRRRRQTPPLLGEFRPELADEPVHARLYNDDDEYIKLKQATGIPNSELVRNYVRKGVEAERLGRAARDPYVARLVDLLNATLDEHTGKLERRLSAELHTLRRLTATAVVLANSSMRLLELYAATGAPPTRKVFEERRRSFLGELSERVVKEAEGILDTMLDERESVLSLLAEKELTSPVGDADLNAALDSENLSPAEGEDDEDTNP